MPSPPAALRHQHRGVRAPGAQCALPAALRLCGRLSRGRREGPGAGLRSESSPGPPTGFCGVRDTEEPDSPGCRQGPVTCSSSRSPHLGQAGFVSVTRSAPDFPPGRLRGEAGGSGGPRAAQPGCLWSLRWLSG